MLLNIPISASADVEKVSGGTKTGMYVSYKTTE